MSYSEKLTSSPRAAFDPSAIAKNYWSLSTDRRFVIPAATVSLILGALFAMFSALPRVLIEGLDFTPLQLGLFFAGTVMIVFSAGIIATKIVPHLGLDRSICIGLALACVGGGMVLLFALFDGRFLPFLAGACVFLLGMGMVNPLCSAQSLSPFGDRAGAASALLGFWQMLAAALGVSLAAVIAKDAMIGLGLVLVLASILASAIYQFRRKG